MCHLSSVPESRAGYSSKQSSCDGRASRAQDHSSHTVVWVSRLGLHSVKSHSAPGCLCLCRAVGDIRAFFPLCQQLARECLLGCQILSLFAFVCLSGTQGSLSYHLRLHHSIHLCGTCWRVEGEQPWRACGAAMVFEVL